MAKVPIYSRSGICAYALVDDEDLSLVSDYRWHLSPQGYAQTGARRSVMLMHRLVMGLVAGDTREAHHGLGGRLDNRRSNLEVLTQVAHVRRHHATGNAAYDKARGNWRARVRVHGERRWLGRYTTEAEARAAAAAYQREIDAP